MKHVEAKVAILAYVILVAALYMLTQFIPEFAVLGWSDWIVVVPSTGTAVLGAILSLKEKHVYRWLFGFLFFITLSVAAGQFQVGHSILEARKTSAELNSRLERIQKKLDVYEQPAPPQQISTMRVDVVLEQETPTIERYARKMHTLPSSDAFRLRKKEFSGGGYNFRIVEASLEQKTPHLRLAYYQLSPEVIPPGTVGELDKFQTVIYPWGFEPTDVQEALRLKSLQLKIYVNNTLIAEHKFDSSDLKHNGVNDERYLPKLFKSAAETYSRNWK
jgi:hypothetical protein